MIVDESIKKKVNELIQEKDNAVDRAKAIYEWVASNIRYVAIEYGESGLRPHIPTEVFKNKYGDC